MKPLASRRSRPRARARELRRISRTWRGAFLGRRVVRGATTPPPGRRRVGPPFRHAMYSHVRRASATSLVAFARARAGGTPLAPAPIRCVATAASARARSRALPAASDPTEGGFAVAGVALVGALAGTLAVATLDPTRADAPPEVGSLPFDRAQAVVDYLASAGASFPRVDVRPVDTGVGHVEAHGMGIFAKPSPGDVPEVGGGGGGGGGLLGSLFGGGARPVTMARVPARLAITAAAAAQHPILGPTFREMLENDDIDERMAVMLLLIVERRRGDKSPTKPYLDALPSSFRTPLFYHPEEMDGLRGTNLHGAVAAQREQLANVLRDHVRPAAARLFAALRDTPSPDAVASGRSPRRDRFGFGVVGERVDARPVSAEEFLWAYACFWSRALSLPLGDDPMRPGIEAIVPGIDFANHSSSRPNARWATTRVDGETVVELLCEPGNVPEPGREVLISYGDKSNEELLFVHGFAERDNPHDALVLRSPHPPGDEKPRPPTTDDEASLAAEVDSEARTARETLRKLRGLPAHVTLPANPPAGGLSAMPADARASLEIWGYSPERLRAELHVELERRLGAGLAEQTRGDGTKGAAGLAPATDAQRRDAALEGLRAALRAQTARLEDARSPTRTASENGKGKGRVERTSGGGEARAGSRAAIAAAVAAASARRVDEVVAADPLAPPVARQTATYRAGVARMTRAYEDAVAKWR